MIVNIRELYSFSNPESGPLTTLLVDSESFTIFTVDVGDAIRRHQSV